MCCPGIVSRPAGTLSLRLLICTVALYFPPCQARVPRPQAVSQLSTAWVGVILQKPSQAPGWFEGWSSAWGHCWGGDRCGCHCAVPVVLILAEACGDFPPSPQLLYLPPFKRLLSFCLPFTTQPIFNFGVGGGEEGLRVVVSPLSPLFLPALLWGMTSLFCPPCSHLSHLSSPAPLTFFLLSGSLSLSPISLSHRCPLLGTLPTTVTTVPAWNGFTRW